MSLIPSKDLLWQIVRCEKLSKYFPSSEVSSEELLARILIGDKSIADIKALDKDDLHLAEKCYEISDEPKLAQ